MESQEFYRQLPLLASFADSLDPVAYQPVPADWWVILTDVRGSTKAIEAGRYKEVNSAGSIGVMALANHFGHMEFPFIFGGDGMTCLVPPTQAAAARDLMAGTVRHVKQAFGLDLRLAVVPVQELYRQNRRLGLAKLRVSARYTQALLDGDGLDLAETLMKTPGSPWLIDPALPTALEPDFSGYTCRWEDYRSPHGETVALIIKFRSGTDSRRGQALRELENLIGSPEVCHPLRAELGRMSLRKARLNLETAVQVGTGRGWAAWKHRMKLRLLVLSGMIMVAFHIHHVIGKRDISESPIDNILSSDFRKFDNTLKMIVALSRPHRQALETWLKAQQTDGLLDYGLHVTDRAMITCLLYNQGDGEVHFVDAADGGYAYAAKQLKAALAPKP